MHFCVQQESRITLVQTFFLSKIIYLHTIYTQTFTHTKTFVRKYVKLVPKNNMYLYHRHQEVMSIMMSRTVCISCLKNLHLQTELFYIAVMDCNDLFTDRATVMFTYFWNFVVSQWTETILLNCSKSAPGI